MHAPIFNLPVQVYIEDTDTNGIVYHANYLRYMERARTEWLRSLGYNRADITAMGIMLVVKKIEIDYLAPARLDDSLLSVVHSFTLQKVSIRLHQAIYLLHHTKEKHINDKKMTKLCDAQVQIAFIDCIHFKPCSFEDMRSLLKTKYLMHS